MVFLRDGNKPASWQTHKLPSRRITLSLLTIACSLIFALTVLDTFSSIGPSAVSVLGLGSSQAGYTAPTNDSSSEPSSGDDNFILHPEKHVYRDTTTIHLKWNVTLDHIYPDGVKKAVILINGRRFRSSYLQSAPPAGWDLYSLVTLTIRTGQFPGPTIEARSGDELVVDVYNGIESDVLNNKLISIHWHGLSMKGMHCTCF